jgi:hypothetical protein
MPLANFGTGLEPVFAFQRFFGCNGGTRVVKDVAQLLEMLGRGSCVIGRERAPNGKPGKQDQHARQAEGGQPVGANPISPARGAGE